MPRTKSDLSTLVSTKLADTALTYIPTPSINYQLRESLKEVSQLSWYLFPVIYKLESRYGTDATGTASKLTDSVKGQFLSTDLTNEFYS